jgi:hypothetical protein
MIYLAAFDGCFDLTPLIVVIIFRRIAPITVLYALVLFIVLIGRSYYLVRLNQVGLSGLVRPFDVPGILLIMLSAISVAVILVRLLFPFMNVIVGIATRKWEP